MNRIYINFRYYIFFCIIVSLSFTGNIAAKCKDFSLTELVNLLVTKNHFATLDKDCIKDKKYDFYLSGVLASYLTLDKTVQYHSYEFEPAHWQNLSFFRKIEIELIKKIGAPIYSLKEGNNTDLESDAYSIALGKIKYKTVWEHSGMNLVLIMSGTGYQIRLSCYFETDTKFN